MYKVLIKPELGRFAVAAKDIKAGDIIFEEIPFAVGPKQDSPTVCLGCYAFVDGTSNGPRCPKCKWPLCPDCVDSIVHQKECELFVQKNIKFQNMFKSDAICQQLDCITPLRILLEKETNPQRWESEISVMEHHEEERKKTLSWEIDETNIVQYLRGPCRLTQFSHELIQHSCGLLQVNAFEAKTKNGNAIRGLFPQLAILAHSCVPNTSHSISLDGGFKLACRATVDIPENEIIYSTYTYTMSGTSARQNYLKDSKFFTCRCNRCLDPSELGTHFSSFKCNKCDLGLILSTNPLDDAAEWKCSHCTFKTNGGQIQKAISVMQNEISFLDNLENDAVRVENTEKLLRKFRSILHPRHYLLIGLKQSLVEMIGRVNGYEMQELPDVVIEHKIDMIKDILKVLDVVEPGKTRSRALILFELHIPVMALARTAYQAGILEGEELKKKLKEVIDILEECYTILKWEDPNSQEGILAQVTKDATNQLLESIDQVK